MRIKFFRILPEICASTWCLLSNCTRNIAFGNGSMTVAITSMASSFGFPESAFFFSGRGVFAIRSKILPGCSYRFSGPSQNPRTIRSDRHGVFEMRRAAAVGGHRGPLIVENPHFRPACVNHRLDGENHAFLDARAVAGLAVIRQVRLFVHFGANSMADELTHHREAMLFDPLLHGRGDITQAIPRPNLLNGLIQGFASHAQQIANLGPNLTDGQRDRGIPVIAVQLDSEIERNNIPFLQAPGARRYAVNYLLVDRGAQHTRITAIALERRTSAMFLSALSGDLLQVECAHARLHGLAQPIQHVPDHYAGAMHRLEFRGGLTNDHCF